MQILSDLFNLYYSKMNYFKNNKHIFKDKNIYAYSIIGTAISYFILNKVYNYFFKTNSKSKNIIKMSIASNRLKRLFNYEKCFIKQTNTLRDLEVGVMHVSGQVQVTKGHHM